MGYYDRFRESDQLITGSVDDVDLMSLLLILNIFSLECFIFVTIALTLPYYGTVGIL